MNCYELIEAALEKAEDGKKNGAWRLYNQALEICGDARGFVLFEMGRFKFFCGEYEDAMNLFLEAYAIEYEKETIREIILEAYYKPNEKDIKGVYEKNKCILKDYPYILDNQFKDYDELNYCFIPVTEERMVIYNKESKEFLTDYYQNSATVDTFGRKAGEITLMVDEYRSNNIAKIRDVTYDPNRYHEMRNAIYLVYGNRIEFENYLQVMDLSKIIEDSRAVFLFGESEIYLWFSELMYQTPSVVMAGKNATGNFLEIINEIVLSREKEFEENQLKIKEYYQKIGKMGILGRLKIDRPRVYIPTSRYTTALQYHARDCKLALEELGCEVLLSIENNDLQVCNSFERAHNLANFIPDLIFSIDHFRGDLDPLESVYVTWIQDPLPWIMNSEAPKKLTEMDIILNAFFTSKDLLNYGYPNNKMIDGPIGVNDRVYHKREVTTIFYEKYKADIIAFSNAGDPDKGFAEFCNQIKPLIDQNLKIREVFHKLYRSIYENAYNGVNIYSKEQYKELIQKEMIKNKWSIENATLDQIADIFKHSVGYRILRSVPLEWLAEKGYNIKIYGDEWVDHKKLKKYAMGRAENGEVLSRIIGCSKIVVGTNPGLTTHPRVGESYLSGSLYIAEAIPKEYDYADITEFLKKDEEIIFFKGKNELFRLADYYLTHEEERLVFTKKASIGVKRDLTHKALMKRMLEEIPVILEKEMRKK